MEKSFPDEMRKGTCKHWRGFHRRHCEAGVDLVAFNGGTTDAMALYLPCSNMFDTDRRKKGIQAIPCDLREEPTDEDIAAFDAENKAAVDRIRTVVPLMNRIRKELKGKGGNGVEDCPACGEKDSLA